MELKFAESTRTTMALTFSVALRHRIQPTSGGLPMEVASASQTEASEQPTLSMVRVFAKLVYFSGLSCHCI